MVDEPPIDNELLISLVEQKRLLWDKTSELYKNRVATQSAWEEIARLFDPNFEEKEEGTKHAFVKLIIQRWTYLRDSYGRSCKKIQDQLASGNSSKITKPYLYSKQLYFLQKIIQFKDDTESEKQENDSNNETKSSTHNIRIKKTPKTQRVPKRSVQNDDGPLNVKLKKILDSYTSNEPKPRNRHLSFFNGILPSLENLNDDEVLEFQVGVLQLLKGIKNNRQSQEASSSFSVTYIENV